MPAKKNSGKTTRELLIERYMTLVLEQEAAPRSVYKFCKDNDIPEAEFYQQFGSMEGLQKAIWDTFFDNTQGLLLKNKAFQQGSNREKMLTFFFTFFELLALNRSYILLTLKGQGNILRNLEQLKGLRIRIRNFAKELIEDGNIDKAVPLTKRNPAIFSEGAWVQFLFLLKFWMEDASAGFEKTDMAIEKSVNTIFDLFDHTPLDSILDFGKFLYKEHLA